MEILKQFHYTGFPQARIKKPENACYRLISNVISNSNDSVKDEERKAQ